MRVDDDGGVVNLAGRLADGGLGVNDNGKREWKQEGNGKASLVHGEQEFYTMRLTVESHRWTGETPVAPSTFSSGIDRGQSLFDALLKRLVSVDRSFAVVDGFEAGL